MPCDIIIKLFSCILSLIGIFVNWSKTVGWINIEVEDIYKHCLSFKLGKRYILKKK
jgi:hypothetical protein